MSNTKTFNIDINNIDGTKSSVYATALLSLNSEGIIKINNEYLTYKTIAGVSGGVATIQIIKRGIANTDVQDIYNGLRVQFYKILAKQSAEGFKTTAINAGDNVNNYAVVNEDVGVQIKGNGSGSGSSYINLNNGTFQAGRVSNITGKSDFNGMYLGDTIIANNKHVYYDGTTVKISANVEIGNSTASTIESNASNAWGKFSGVGNTLPSGNVEFNFATSSTKGGNANDTDYVNGVSSSTITYNIAKALTDASTAQSTADGKITTFYQDNPPTISMSEGDIWFDTNDGNKIYIYEGTTWVNRQDSKIAQAINDASNAQGTADSKITTFYTSTQPTAISMGDLWYNTLNYEIKRWDGSIWRLVADVTANKTANNTSNVGSQTASAVQNSTINFNGRNDRNATAIVIPTINSDGTAIDHTVNTDSTSNISFEWNWAGTNADIDGFIVFIRQKSTTSSYTFGSTPSEEQVFYVTPEKRAFILYGVPVNQFYHFGIQAYRIVDTDINSNNVIKTTIIQPSLSNENPYQPSSTVAFAGDVSGTVSGTSASTVVSNALNGQTAYNGTNIIRDTTSSPTNNAVFGSITFNSTSDGNIVANIPYTYTQGAINADSLVFYYKKGGGTVTSSDVAYIKNAVSGNINFILIPNTVYSFGIQAVRKSNNTTIGGSIVQSGNRTTPAGNYTNKINSSDTSNYLYVGSNVKIGKDAYATGKDGVSITTNGYLNVANNNNALYFDPTVNGDLSYLRMNGGSQQIGKVAGLTKIVPQSDFNGFFIGDKDLTNKNYMLYNGFGIDLKSKVVGSVAYVNSDYEFDNAINGVGNYAPFEYNEICLTSSFNLTKDYLIPTFIKKINLNSYILNEYSITAEHSLNIFNGQLNCATYSTVSTNKLYLENIYSSAGFFAGCILKNIEINKTSGNFIALFRNCINSTGIKINISSSVTGTLFDSCNNISNIEIDIPTYSSSLSIFNLCMSVSNFKIKINGGKISGAGILGSINGYSYCNSMVVNGYINYYDTNGSLSLPELNYIYSMSNVTGHFSSTPFQENMFFIDYDSCDIDKPQVFKEINVMAINEPTTTIYKQFYIPKKSQILKIDFTTTSQGYVAENTELDIDSSITGYTYVLNIINNAGTWRMYKVYSSGNMATQVTTYFTVNPKNISFFIKTDVTTRFMNIVSIGG